MILRELMTHNVVTAPADEDALSVARLMRDHNVGSVVICDRQGLPCAMVTDRDLATRVLADDAPPATPIDRYVSRPLITGEPDMEITEAAAKMVQHGIRRLPVLEGDQLRGIVTIDDLAVRTGDLEVAQKMTHDVIEGAMPQFFFRERG